MNHALASSLVLLGLFFPEPASGKNRRVEVDGPRLTMGDVVSSVTGDLASLDLGPAPRPGRTRVLTRGELQERLRQAMLDPAGIRIPRRIVVSRPAQRLSELDLRRALRQAIASELPVGADLKRIYVSSGMVLPRGPVKLDVELGRPARSGRQTVQVGITVGGERYRVMPVGIDLTVETKNRRAGVKRGEKVTLVVVTTGVRVEASGTAQQDASVGAQVAVMAQVAKRVVRGVVRSPGLVEVLP